MTRLKYKVFIVISTILTLFFLTILLIFNYQNYKQEKMSIENTLKRVIEPFKKEEPFTSNIPVHEEEPRFFLDTIVYTVTIEDNKITDVISHFPDTDEEDKIRNIAEEIISNKERKTYIGNLYISKYSYTFQNNNENLVIVDNANANEKVLSFLKISILLFIILEILIIIISYIITNWIIKPVIASFAYQKRFIADASHELKTPLTVIMANTEMAEREPKNKKWLNNIKSEAERMNKLVVDLLNLAKLEDEQENISLEKNNLSKISEISILPFESLIYEKNLKLDYHIEPDIKLICNQDKIKQLFSILIDNAIKHTTKNGNIIISVYTLKKDIIIEIKNEGQEIAKENLDHLFERFYRVDSSRNRDDNRFGLGLAIAKEIVNIHKGEIKVESNKEYTTFKVIFKQE